jgi:putative phosphoesterase
MIGARPFRRLGLIGDIHAEHEALSTSLRSLASLDVDAILAVGDIVDGVGDPNRCCELLSGAGALVVRGNHERWCLEGTMRDLPEATAPRSLDETSRRFLEGLPRTRELATIGGSLLLCHGLGADDMASLRSGDYGYAIEQNSALQHIVREARHAFVVSGHTHQRLVRRVGGVTFVNAGTLHRAFDPCFGLLDLESERAIFYTLGGGEVREAEQRSLAEWTELLTP